jgi:hypothetical protein
MREIPLSEVAAALAAEKTKTAGPGYKPVPYYNMPMGTLLSLRFLPDKDAEVVLPWAKKCVIRLPFCGMINSDYDTDDMVTATVPSFIFGSIRVDWDAWPDQPCRSGRRPTG